VRKLSVVTPYCTGCSLRTIVEDWLGLRLVLCPNCGEKERDLLNFNTIRGFTSISYTICKMIRHEERERQTDLRGPRRRETEQKRVKEKDQGSKRKIER